ncbi:MFS general substrate transporter [Eremomyces bilateralis CBS 781.70]|uniref:MFS general substrate transporter n=1 Tax=Eremomyces bilateralis CBS 781.70 TaxID=1392243 RepID=A0A6G1GCR1_9PEZI|nr:MFS general substrate transporter [Eremomyces bilateralis CBS 781.70]KAF1815681.1 MFS general substrate transporter [Eremomyces bilateralis CBS 781.70]
MVGRAGRSRPANPILAIFVVSVYVLGFAFGPVVAAPLNEICGRLPAYRVSSVLFVVFSVAYALSTNMGMLIVFHFLMGCCGGVPLTIGAGSIMDVMPTEKRGGALAIWITGPIIEPVIGPVVGGFLSEAKGWRWVFWLLTIVTGALGLVVLFVLRETYAPILQGKKAKRLRNILLPTKIFLFRPVMSVMAVYGILYILYTTFTKKMGTHSYRSTEYPSPIPSPAPRRFLLGYSYMDGQSNIKCIGSSQCLIPLQVYLVDAFTLHAASAIWASNIVRSIAATLLRLCALQMYDALELGWGNSLLGFMALILVPVPVIFRKYGPYLREQYPLSL